MIAVWKLEALWIRYVWSTRMVIYIEVFARSKTRTQFGFKVLQCFINWWRIDWAQTVVHTGTYHAFGLILQILKIMILAAWEVEKVSLLMGVFKTWSQQSICPLLNSTRIKLPTINSLTPASMQRTADNFFCCGISKAWHWEEGGLSHRALELLSRACESSVLDLLIQMISVM